MANIDNTLSLLFYIIPLNRRRDRSFHVHLLPAVKMSRCELSKIIFSKSVRGLSSSASVCPEAAGILCNKASTTAATSSLGSVGHKRVTSVMG